VESIAAMQQTTEKEQKKTSLIRKLARLVRVIAGKS
jgi:hypothetical protein